MTHQVDVLFRFLGRLLLLTTLIEALPFGGRGQAFFPESAGARFGFGGDSSSTAFHQDEAFVDWKLPWQIELGRDWRLETRLDLAGGWLGKGGQNAAVGSAGPIFSLGHDKFPVWFEAGSSPTLVSRHEFGRQGAFGAKDFGDAFQFTSHIGFYVNILSKVRVGYRFQHMSNGGLASPNPGLNMQMLYASYLF